jgi:hypothetical protein
MIAEGIYCDINITSRYIYYREFNLEGVTYHQSLYGAIAPSPFLPFE